MNFVAAILYAVSSSVLLAVGLAFAWGGLDPFSAGTALSFDDDKGRYLVELDESSSSLMIKPCNLLPTVCSVALCSLLFSHVQTLPRLS